MKILKKLTTKNIIGKVSAPEHDQSTELYTVYGQAAGYSVGETDKGTYLAFSGTFEAVPASGAETYRAGKLILPEIAAEPLAGALSGASGAVEFGYKVGVRGDESSVTGYVYWAEPLLSPDEGDPLEQMRQRLTHQPTSGRSR